MNVFIFLQVELLKTAGQFVTLTVASLKDKDGVYIYTDIVIL